MIMDHIQIIKKYILPKKKKKKKKKVNVTYH